MDNEKFENLLKDNKYEHILNPGIMLPCQYFDEDEFNETNRNDDECLNVFLSILEVYLNTGVNYCISWKA